MAAQKARAFDIGNGLAELKLAGFEQRCWPSGALVAKLVKDTEEKKGIRILAPFLFVNLTKESMPHWVLNAQAGKGDGEEELLYTKGACDTSTLEGLAKSLNKGVTAKPQHCTTIQ